MTIQIKDKVDSSIIKLLEIESDITYDERVDPLRRYNNPKC